MKPSHVVLILLTVWLLLVASGAWAIYAVFVRPGMIEVAFTERHRHHASQKQILVPAGIANGLLGVVSFSDDLARIVVRVADGKSLPRNRDLAEAFTILAEELEFEQNLTLLTVHDRNDRVRIDLRDGALQITAEDGSDSVRITIPPSTVRKILKTAADVSR
jgi:hypothetical protein